MNTPVLPHPSPCPWEGVPEGLCLAALSGSTWRLILWHRRGQLHGQVLVLTLCSLPRLYLSLVLGNVNVTLLSKQAKYGPSSLHLCFASLGIPLAPGTAAPPRQTQGWLGSPGVDSLPELFSASFPKNQPNPWLPLTFLPLGWDGTLTLRS